MTDLWCINNETKPLENQETNRLIGVTPSERQKAFMPLRYYSFIHFTVNTFTNREWGDGTEDESVFNPTELDTDQWCRVLKSSGSKGIILTAKHHDGFCLFDTKYTSHNSMNSPVHCDVVDMLSKSCKKYDMKLGIYLSPWDRHEKTYGTPAYNDFFVNQLTELCTKYGEIFEFWFDGACGEGVDGAKQFYDWERIWSTIRKYQPTAVIANCGPDVRWIGNEAGKTRKAEYNVVSWDLSSIDDVQGKSQTNEYDIEHLQSFDRMDEDLGSREKLSKMANLVWLPAEADVSINHAWFYHEDEYYDERKIQRTRTPEELVEIFEKTVGGNASLLLNVPVDKTGKINEKEIEVLDRMTNILTDRYSHRVDFSSKAVNTFGKEREISFPFEFRTNEGKLILNAREMVSSIFIEEDTNYSQRIEKFTVNTQTFSTIGTGKIIKLDISTDTIEISINISRSTPHIKQIVLFK